MFSITEKQIDASALELRLDSKQAGAMVVFTGRVRNHNQGRPVNRLEYEAHTGLAEKSGKIIISEAMAKFDIISALAVHRIGILEIGDTAAWIGVVAAHRGDAFKACQYIIDEIKKRVPIWKKEHYSDGDHGWVSGQPISSGE